MNNLESTYLKILDTNESNINSTEMQRLYFDLDAPSLVLGFVSPHIDFNNISRKIKSLFPSSTKVILASSAGELCTFNIDEKRNKLYNDASSTWDDIVLQSFSALMIEEVEILTVPLFSENLASQNISHKERISKISNEINRLNIPFKINHENTFALTFIDGLSNSESFFTEAVYQSGKLPCLIIGGSAGGKLDFKETYIFDNRDVVRHKAVVTLVKLRKNIKYGVFKSQSCEEMNISYLVAQADVLKRTVTSVLNKSTNQIINFLDVLSYQLKCTLENLPKVLEEYSFAIKLGDEIFIRSVANVDIENKHISFFCDISFGDVLYLVKRKDFVQQTDSDYRKFSSTKRMAPLGGMFNDCILRRLFNQNHLNSLKTFNDIPIAGFSTFGELLGLNINQTLTALFFYHVENEKDFADEYVDNFVQKYAQFSSYYEKKEIYQQQLLSRVRNSLLSTLKEAFPLIHDMVDILNSVYTNTKQGNEIIDEVNNKFASFSQDINNNVESNNSLVDNMQTLTKNADQIKKVLSSISSIAIQTNLLALNAAIEASKAGEFGKGFKVVADEVKKLAKTTQESVKESNSSADVTIKGIGDISVIINSASSTLEKISADTSTISESFSQIKQSSQDSNSFIEEKKDGFDMLIDSIDKIASIQQNLEQLEEHM